MRQRRRRPSWTKDPPASTQEQVWQLVENDSEMRTILKDVRSRINDYADRNEQRLLNRQPQRADPEAEGTLHVLLLRGQGLEAKGRLARYTLPVGVLERWTRRARRSLLKATQSVASSRW